MKLSACEGRHLDRQSSSSVMWTKAREMRRVAIIIPLLWMVDSPIRSVVIFLMDICHTIGPDLFSYVDWMYLERCRGIKRIQLTGL